MLQIHAKTEAAAFQRLIKATAERVNSFLLTTGGGIDRSLRLRDFNRKKVFFVLFFVNWETSRYS